MNAIAKRAQSAISCVVAAVVGMPLTAHHTLCAQSATRLADEPANHRFVAVLDSRQPNSSATLGITQGIITGGHITHSAMLHRFHVEAVDSADQPVAVNGDWAVTIFADTASDAGRPAMEPIIQLSAYAHDVAVPRPFGCRLHSADSLLVVATFDTTVAARGLRLRVTVDYDAIPQSRLAVRTVQSSEGADVASEPRAAGAAPDRTLRTLEWRPAMAGEMVAITGLSLAGVDRLVLQDVQTGEVLWRSHPTAGADAGQTVRPSAIVEAGGLYRLTVSYIKAAARTPAPNHGSALAIVLPSRIGQ